MNIIEFCEKICQVKLLEWQKEYLRTWYKKVPESDLLFNKSVPLDELEEKIQNGKLQTLQ